MNTVILYVLLFLLFYLPDFIWALCSGETLSNFMTAAASAAVISAPFFAVGLALLRWLPVRLAAWPVVVASALLALPAAIGLCHHAIYGHGITPSSFYIALNSNAAEAMNYGRLYASGKLVSLLALFALAQAALSACFVKRVRLSPRPGWKALALVALPGLLAFELVPTLPERHRMLEQCVNAYNLYRFDEIKMKIMRDRNRRARPSAVRRTETVAERETYVLVIGESAARSHMGLYGYFRDTTPLLSAQRNQLVVFKDVVSASFCTYLSLRKMLTFANYEDMTPLYDSHLVDIMKAAGFKTYWISNQKSHSNGDIWSKYFSESADVRVYLNTAEFSDPWDGDLIAPFAEVLKNGDRKKFIVVHMMGSHLHASNRYPAAFRRYSSTDDPKAYFRDRSQKIKEYVNHYDNSILYTDTILDNLLSRLKGAEGAKALLFLSDHSDQLGEQDDFVGRGYRVNHFQYDVPFLVWLSPEYRQARKAFSARLGNYVARRYQADDLIHSFMDLAAVSSSSFDRHRSVFSDNFREKTRHLEIPLDPQVDLLPNVSRKGK